MSGSDADMRSVLGLVLAAGSGSRMGRPKALVTGPSGEAWLARAARVLREGGCDPVYVVIGAATEEVRRVVPAGVEVVVAEDWEEGMGASLRTGLGAILLAASASTSASGAASATAVLVMLVDTPDVSAAVVRRLLASDASVQALGRSTYEGVPGHPVLIGRDHWAGVLATARGDRGARDYLARHPVTLVECADLGSGTDVDTSVDLEAWRGSDPTTR